MLLIKINLKEKAEGRIDVFVEKKKLNQVLRHFVTLTHRFSVFSATRLD